VAALALLIDRLGRCPVFLVASASRLMALRYGLTITG